ncbi:hypothetical protein [Methanococcus maripaludis]|uniref:Putative PP-loop superfamily ATPase n=1 Tax=Methanococcus maripaludis TaxID=39152 RepID=A0A8T4H898_METMI|nr:hypothetical protein [Methanococcus maripaludis]MBM7408547.1 putative PP-loop superfamily ATPase [Methanococcus maripaludis]MBP2220144.1 putative PP-loop superfamily ATPase [Methanococcus maripaludis]
MQYIDKSKEEFLSEIYRIVAKIRLEIELTTSEITISDFEFKIDSENNENLILMIYTPTRTDKSLLIGPGGWVVGKLREKLNGSFKENLIIRVESYIDRKKELDAIENSISHLREKGLDISSKKDALVIIQCEYDLSSIDFINEYFNPIFITFDLGTALLPHKNRNRIEQVFKDKNLKYEFLSPYSLNGEQITDAISKNPCEIICNDLISEMVNYAKNKNIEIVLFNHLNKDYEFRNGIHILNFLKMFPIKLNSLIHKGRSLDCPLLIQSCKRNKITKTYKIKQIVSGVYSGLVEPTEGAEEIIKYLK